MNHRQQREERALALLRAAFAAPLPPPRPKRPDVTPAPTVKDGRLVLDLRRC